ncbi:hypothetical protein JCM8547_004269 [Rhodosporidiobolus lusitaniae]
MRWIWEDSKKEMGIDQASWLIEEANRDRRLLPFYILLREHASTLRFSDAMEKAQRELQTYLASTAASSLSSREQRARLLLVWLNERPKRWYTFFCTPDGAGRPGAADGGGSWEWWLSESGETMSHGLLDEWEEEMEKRTGRT